MTYQISYYLDKMQFEQVYCQKYLQYVDCP